MSRESVACVTGKPRRASTLTNACWLGRGPSCASSTMSCCLANFVIPNNYAIRCINMQLGGQLCQPKNVRGVAEGNVPTKSGGLIHKGHEGTQKSEPRSSRRVAGGPHKIFCCPELAFRVPSCPLWVAVI